MLAHCWSPMFESLKVERTKDGGYRLSNSDSSFSLHLTEREALDVAEQINRLSVQPAKAAA